MCGLQNRRVSTPKRSVTLVNSYFLVQKTHANPMAVDRLRTTKLSCVYFIPCLIDLASALQPCSYSDCRPNASILPFRALVQLSSPKHSLQSFKNIFFELQTYNKLRRIMQRTDAYLSIRSNSFPFSHRLRSVTLSGASTSTRTDLMEQSCRYRPAVTRPSNEPGSS
jgi:hypothetical protein